MNRFPGTTIAEDREAELAGLRDDAEAIDTEIQRALARLQAATVDNLEAVLTPAGIMAANRIAGAVVAAADAAEAYMAANPTRRAP